MDFTGYPHLEQIYAGLGRAVDSILRGRRNPPGPLADARYQVRRVIDFKALHDDATVQQLNDALADARKALANDGHDVSAFDAATGHAFNPEPPPDAAVDTTRPETLPEQATEDPSVVPSEGGPWTAAHAQAMAGLVSAVGGHTSLALASSATPISGALAPFTGNPTVTGLTPQVVSAIADDRIPEQYTEQKPQYKTVDGGEREPLAPATASDDQWGPGDGADDESAEQPAADEATLVGHDPNGPVGGAEEIGDGRPAQTSTAPDWTGASIPDHQGANLSAQNQGANLSAQYQGNYPQEAARANQQIGFPQAQFRNEGQTSVQVPQQRQGDGTET